ncbi:hypothetical protein [Mycolicibacterium aromaticivorans]|uniref:hypothetical protein n=1 Tax=Mycolicibacterium aromaticivorans TaxID=318425 RepID=UPI00044C4930|nr:hypothetical protein [Mycolicibacterium aromaticivorans]
MSRARITAFLALFGLVEVVLVLSIDGAFYPFQWFDFCSAAIIFGLMYLIASLSLSDPSKDRDDER